MSSFVVVEPDRPGFLSYPPELEEFVLSADDLEYGQVKGSGSFGTVYGGRVKSLRGAVAIKKLKPLISNSQKDHFLREITVQAFCKHPCILPLIGFVPSCRTPVIVTKLVCGGSLASILTESRMSMRRTQMSQAHLACCFYGIATAVAFLHERGYVHRDIKPSNILLGQPSPMPLLCDFGQAREVATDMTEAPGSELFMAPEMYSESYTEKVDVYAFGMTLYVMLARRNPVTLRLAPEASAGSSPVRDEKPGVSQFMRRVRKGERFPREDCIDKSYWELIQRCWAGEPDERPSFREIVAMMREHPEDYCLDAKNVNVFETYINKLNQEIAKMPKEGLRRNSV